MRRIVALDLARVGAAAWRDGDSIRTRHFVLAKESAPTEEKVANLLAILTSLFAEIGPSAISVEDDTGRGAGARTLRTFYALDKVAARKVRAFYR